MKTSATGIRLIKDFEKLRLTPYLCDAGKPTIGWGNTYYPDGKKVTLTDKPITKEYADEIFEIILASFERDVNSLLTVTVSQHQFDSLVSFAFNTGSDIDADTIAEGLGDSTLLKYVNENPNDLRIIGEFMKWNKSRKNGVLKPSKGLTRRRKVESHYYSTGILNLELE